MSRSQKKKEKKKPNSARHVYEARYESSISQQMGGSGQHVYSRFLKSVMGHSEAIEMACILKGVVWGIQRTLKWPAF
jgi:hypothetical protein